MKGEGLGSRREVSTGNVEAKREEMEEKGSR